MAQKGFPDCFIYKIVAKILAKKNENCNALYY